MRYQLGGHGDGARWLRNEAEKPNISNIWVQKHDKCHPSLMSLMCDNVKNCNVVTVLMYRHWVWSSVVMCVHVLQSHSTKGSLVELIADQRPAMCQLIMIILHWVNRGRIWWQRKEQSPVFKQRGLIWFDYFFSHLFIVGQLNNWSRTIGHNIKTTDSLSD